MILRHDKVVLHTVNLISGDQNQNDLDRKMCEQNVLSFYATGEMPPVQLRHHRPTTGKGQDGQKCAYRSDPYVAPPLQMRLDDLISLCISSAQLALVRVLLPTALAPSPLWLLLARSTPSSMSETSP